ncbi:MAG: hypothetical protein HFF17_04400, partial [Oscillospiraceae bacterium]|nr:hypothetical protein [Oscillospiraceae bacterium]
TNATLLVRYACDGTKPASNHATVTVPSRNAAPTADIDRVAELLTVSDTAPEYWTENGWTAVPVDGLDLPGFYGKELAVREKYDSEHFASLPVLLILTRSLEASGTANGKPFSLTKTGTC